MLLQSFWSNVDWDHIARKKALHMTVRGPEKVDNHCALPTFSPGSVSEMLQDHGSELC